jgi:hypothetical protein
MSIKGWENPKTWLHAMSIAHGFGYNGFIAHNTELLVASDVVTQLSTGGYQSQCLNNSRRHAASA